MQNALAVQGKGEGTKTLQSQRKANMFLPSALKESVSSQENNYNNNGYPGGMRFSSLLLQRR